MEVSDNIRAYLKAKGITDADLKKMTGIPHSSFFEVMDGTIKNPGYKFIEAVIRNSDINPDFLLSGVGDPIRPYPIEGTPVTRRELLRELAQLDKLIEGRHRELKTGSRRTAAILQAIASQLQIELPPEEPEAPPQE